MFIFSLNYLENKCDFVGCGNFPSNNDDHSYKHFESSKKSKTEHHCLFIEVYSYQIICFDCNQEIYDIELFLKIIVISLKSLYRYSKEEIKETCERWKNPNSIRSILLNPDHRIFQENLGSNPYLNF